MFIGENMKKVFPAIVLLLAVSCLIYGGFFLFNKTKPSKLEQMGYTKEEITLITSQLSNEEINILETKNYNIKIPELLTIEGFEFEKIDRYLNYADQNQTVELKEIISLVNADIDQLDIPYQKEINYLLHQTYFIQDNLERYLSYQKENSTKSYEQIVQEVNVHLDYPFYEHDIPTDFSKGNLIIANKYYTLGSKFIPENLVTLIECSKPNRQVTKETADAYTSMCQAMKKEGLNLLATSTYRSYQTQVSLYNGYVNQHGQAWADSCSSRAGHSEHQTGLTIDVITPTTDFSTFQYSKEFDWLQEHAHQYGFILRYPEGKDYLTGYEYEPWHYRYVGIEDATKIHELNITYDEYYEYFVK